MAIVRSLKKLPDLLPLPWEEREVHWEDPESGYRVEKVRTQWDYQLEGYLLAHCLGTKNADVFGRIHRVFSVREPEGIPHCTILTTFAPRLSPYGQSADLATKDPMTLKEGKRRHKAWVLQVRGRTDLVAYPAFHQIARRWYKAHKGGKLLDDEKMDELLLNLKFLDRDITYHFLGLLDESVNHFGWSHWNAKAVEEARKEGTSL